ncbi:ECF transporter S component [Aceticella autotrophica]|uniref:ECF transporter S component n=1 Tax=Aceticella autotrophica TaxID=2755338 RepID=A0A975GAQ8_9THEO|nr:ECF transporter S component [Aceticella autotrophica]QSZ27729.1 ECF transporter S component [Aceticella autotrophica]
MDKNSSKPITNTQFITRTAVLLAITIIIQFIKMPQLITGSLVNTMLIIAAGLVGMWSGITIGLLTPIIAFAVGIMGFPIMIPFIMIGNALYVLLYSLIKNKIVSMIIGSIVKFLWLSISVKYLLNLFNVKVPLKIVQAFTLPQLITALTGGIIALIFISLMNNYFAKAKQE